MDPYGYNKYRYKYNYKGRKRKQKIIIIVTVVVIAAVIVAFFLFKDEIFADKKNSPDEITPQLNESDSENIINVTENPEDIIMPPPVKVKGVYITAWSAANKDKFENFIKLCDETEINALVIDVKDDEGKITFLSDISKNSNAEANIIKNPVETISLLKSHGIYAIARIVCFKDPIWSAENPELAIKDINGGLWTDTKGNTWLDPYKKGSWDYLVSIAGEAAKLGFDEVQFDYVRFPTDGNIKNIDYGSAADEKSKTYVISEFLKYAKEQLKSKKIYVSADVFGIIAVSQTDSETIGQNIEVMARYADSICPMIYPSHYANKRQNGEGQNINGILFEAPDIKPYEVVYNTLLMIKDWLIYSRDGAVIRPYLQDFTAAYLGAGYYQEYGAKQVREQIQAVYDAGYEEWILWNASNIYSESAFR